MIQLYADNKLVYDSREADRPLLQLTATMALNKGGAATIQMPPKHPAYNAFVSYKTIVDIYRDGVRLFRGRALYPTDDFRLCRTITCEGERCFLRDAINRPRGFAGSLSEVFSAVIAYYNAEVNSEKQFNVGTVSVVNSGGDIKLEIEEAETFADTIDKLVSAYGGYIVFTDNPYGQRTINWYDSMDYRSSQTVELGKNLVDFTRTTANSDLATVIIPYGAKDDNGNRIDIKSVNNNLDYIEDADAVALRGRIAKVVIFENTTDPARLLIKAQQYLEQSKNLVASLSLSAVDLSLVDKSVDSFRVGDNVTVRTAVHGIYDETYLLTEQTIDFLNPQNDRITLGRAENTLTAADAEGDKTATIATQQLAQEIKNDYATNINSTIEDVKQELTSSIQQSSEDLKTEISEKYVTNEELESALSTSMTQTSESFDFSFDEIEKKVDANDAEARAQFVTIEKYIRFIDGNIIIGEANNALTLKIAKDRISFLENGGEIAYLSNNKLYIIDSEFVRSLRLGNFEAKIRNNGNLSLIRL